MNQARETRLTKLEQAQADEDLAPEERRSRQVEALLAKDGLSHLLAAGALLPQRDPWDLPGVYEDAPGFGGLLWQCRQAQEHGP